jgi:hypothetical protein
MTTVTFEPQDNGMSWSEMFAQATGKLGGMLFPNPKSIAKKAIKVAPALAATYFTGGAAAPLLASALGSGGAGGLLGAGGSAMQQAGVGMLGNFAGQLGQSSQPGMDEITRRRMIADGMY